MSMAVKPVVGAVWSARLSEDATLAATGSADFSAKVWDTFTGETLHTLQHNHIVRAVAFPPHEKPQILATGGMEKKLRVYDLSRAANAPATNGINGNDSTPSYEIGDGVHQLGHGLGVGCHPLQQRDGRGVVGDAHHQDAHGWVTRPCLRCSW